VHFFDFPEKSFPWTSPSRVFEEARPVRGLSAAKKIPEKTEVFPDPLGLSQVPKGSRPKQKKKKKLVQFSAQRKTLDKSLTGF
jgi:hypothetical protein